MASKFAMQFLSAGSAAQRNAAVQDLMAQYKQPAFADIKLQPSLQSASQSVGTPVSLTFQEAEYAADRKRLAQLVSNWWQNRQQSPFPEEKIVSILSKYQPELAFQMIQLDVPLLINKAALFTSNKGKQIMNAYFKRKPQFQDTDL